MAWARVAATWVASLGSRRAATADRPRANLPSALGSVVLLIAWAGGGGRRSGPPPGAPPGGPPPTGPAPPGPAAHGGVWSCSWPEREPGQPFLQPPNPGCQTDSASAPHRSVAPP